MNANNNNTPKSPPSSPTTQAAWRSRSPPQSPLPSLSTTLPGLTAFDRAVHVVNMSNMTSQGIINDSSSSDRVVFSPEDQLLLYGAYKQATKGDVKALKPTFFDIAARSKWQAWSNMRGKTQDEAQAIYVDLVVKVILNFAFYFRNIPISAFLSDACVRVFMLSKELALN
ncbi:hypothetical protein FBU30_001644 [Linnemannia zychae]|nr:hypothetical protein FBU30_001644 [Linnemannia zychae]